MVWPGARQPHGQLERGETEQAYSPTANSKVRRTVPLGVFRFGSKLPGGHIQAPADCAKGRVHLIQAGVVLNIEDAVDLRHVPA